MPSSSDLGKDHFGSAEALWSKDRSALVYPAGTDRVRGRIACGMRDRSG
jgi:hypothetical protein